MSTQTETKVNVKGTQALAEIANPMQERHIDTVTESADVAAEAVLAARRSEVRDEAGRTSTILFVP